MESPDLIDLIHASLLSDGCIVLDRYHSNLRERERQRQTGRERETETQKGWDRVTEGETVRETKRETARGPHTISRAAAMFA
jgi:hypothetical protein